MVGSTEATREAVAVLSARWGKVPDGTQKRSQARPPGPPNVLNRQRRGSERPSGPTLRDPWEEMGAGPGADERACSGLHAGSGGRTLSSASPHRVHIGPSLSAPALQWLPSLWGVPQAPAHTCLCPTGHLHFPEYHKPALPLAWAHAAPSPEMSPPPSSVGRSLRRTGPPD